MIAKTVALAAILFFNLNSAPAPNAVPAQALGPTKYEVRYKFSGKGSKVADATISLEKGNWEGKDALVSHAKITASSVFRLFMAAEYIADAYLTTDAKEPLYSINPIRKGKKEGKFECVYDTRAKTVTSEYAPPSVTPVVETYPMDGLTMDLLSFLQFVRFHDVPVGKTFDMHLLMRGKSVAATLINYGSDKEKYPGYASERIQIKMIDMGLMENGSGKDITVWRSTDGARQILGLEADLSSGTMSVSIVQ